MNLARWSGRREEDPALEDTVRRRTWGELEQRVIAIGNGLLDLAGGAGAHVTIVAGNRLEFMETVLACWLCGLVYTPLKTSWTDLEIEPVLADAGSRLVVTDRPAARTAAARAGRPVIDLDRDFDDWVAAQPDRPPPTTTAGWKLPYTSGTTGRPKGVVPAGAGSLTPQESWAASARWAELLQLPGDGVHLFVSQVFHGAPLTFGLGALASGAVLRMMPRWEAAAALNLLADPAVTSTIMVPTMFRALLALDVDRSDPPAPGLRTLLHGGEPCPASIKQAMLDWFGPCLVEYYGFTEGGLTVADSADWCQRPGTVGRPPPGQEILILDKDGTVLGPHQTGLICFRAVDGGRRFRYLHDSAKTMAAYIGDAYTVGDLGWVDDDGYLFVSGRSDDVVICAGVNIYPAEIEAALADVPGVADLAAVGGPDDERGEHVVLLYTCTEGVDPLTVRADLARQAEVRLAGYKRPREVRLVDEIPRDGTGKLLRRALRSKLTRS